MISKYFIVDSFSDLRKNRQARNDEECANSVLKECVNKKARQRMFNYLLKEFPNKFKNENQITLHLEKDPVLRAIAGMNCSINSSRQGSKDEAYVINGIKEVMEPLIDGLTIENLGAHDKVPIRRTGEVLSRKEAKKKYDKTKMLKSFDFEGKIAGKSFFGSAKILVGKGGHQDNVLQEEAELLRWLSDYGEEDCFYFILLDFEEHATQDLKDLKKSNKMKNVFICNHIELQKKLEELNGQ